MKLYRWIFPCLGLVFAQVALSSAHAADEAQWRVINEAVTPTVVPLYRNLPNPFPVKQDAAAVQVGPTPEELMQQQALLASVQRTQDIVNGQDALQPDFSNVRIGGVLKGPLGWSVLMNGRWIREGSTLALPSRPTDKATKALSDLSSLDPEAAADLSSVVARRMVVSSTVSLQQVTSQSVVLQSPHGRWRFSIGQVGN